MYIYPYLKPIWSAIIHLFWLAHKCAEALGIRNVFLSGYGCTVSNDVVSTPNNSSRETGSVTQVQTVMCIIVNFIIM